jgi:hypothetical protein
VRKFVYKTRVVTSMTIASRGSIRLGITFSLDGYPSIWTSSARHGSGGSPGICLSRHSHHGRPVAHFKNPAPWPEPRNQSAFLMHESGASSWAPAGTASW